VEALIDCGAEKCFIDKDTLARLNIEATPLRKPLEATNVDGTQNRDGLVTHAAMLTVRHEDQKADLPFLVSNLGDDRMILGFPWFAAFNPCVDWEEKTLEGDWTITPAKGKGKEPEEEQVRCRTIRTRIPTQSATQTHEEERSQRTASPPRLSWARQVVFDREEGWKHDVDRSARQLGDEEVIEAIHQYRLKCNDWCAAVRNAQNTPPPPRTYASDSTNFYLTRYNQTEEEAWERVTETQEQIHEAGKVLADLRAFERLRPYLVAKAMLNPTLAEVLEDVDLEDQYQQSH
jgi:hypothetical protein